jgi:DNA-binding transcriptional regulator GbsR (MarR family)
LIQAPFKEKKLAYIGKELLPIFYYSNVSDEIDYKHTETRSVLEFLKEKGSSTRQKIMNQFKLSKEQVMDVLTELRNNFQIFMFYDGTSWTIFSSDILLDTDSISRASAVTELVFQTIKSYGPITVPQIMHMLQMSGGRISTSIIELYENKKIVRGYFVENSSYEAFIAADELQYLTEYVEKYTPADKKEIIILPSSDLMASYWSSADFTVLEENEKELVLLSGKPICTFDYKVISDNLHVINLRKTSEYSSYEEEVRIKIQEFAENKGKMLIFPKLESEEIETQSKEFARILSQRGYSARTAGLVYHLSKFAKKEESKRLVSYDDVFPLLLHFQYMSTQKQTSTKNGLKNCLLSLGIPLSLPSIKLRLNLGKEHLPNEMIIEKQLALGKFGGFNRGYISSEFYYIYSKLSPTRHLGVLEEKAIGVIQRKGKVNFKQLKAEIGLSDRVLLSTLQRLETAHEIVQAKSVSSQIIWYPVSDFLKNMTTKKVETQREAWIDVIYRILSSNLPLTISQIANITGLSNTQIEVYLKELIASKGVRSGKYIEDVNETQFTVKEVEELIAGFILQKEDPDLETKEITSSFYLPRNDPIITLYRTYLLQRFKSRSLFTRSLPTDFAELILINGLPAAALHFKKQEKIEYVNNIEILPEYADSHSLMLLFSSIQTYLNKTKEEGKRQLRIKQIDGIPLYSEAGRKFLTLMKDMQVDFLIQP